MTQVARPGGWRQQGDRDAPTGRGRQSGRGAQSRAAVSRGDPSFSSMRLRRADGWLAASCRHMIAGPRSSAVARAPAACRRRRVATTMRWYLIHRSSRRLVPHHRHEPERAPRAVLLDRRIQHAAAIDYTKRTPVAGAIAGDRHRIYFEPRAVASHTTADQEPAPRTIAGLHGVEAKSQSGAARLAWLYRTLAVDPGEPGTGRGHRR